MLHPSPFPTSGFTHFRVLLGPPRADSLLVMTVREEVTHELLTLAVFGGLIALYLWL